jgi:hypothetical protein
VEAKDDVELTRRLEMPDYKAKTERLVLFSVQAGETHLPAFLLVSMAPENSSPTLHREHRKKQPTFYPHAACRRRQIALWSP